VAELGGRSDACWLFCARRGALPGFLKGVATGISSSRRMAMPSISPRAG